MVLADLDTFLQDHAANERKVSGSAMGMVTHHPDKAELVDALIEVAQEELEHFIAVYALLKARGVPLSQDKPDPYVGALRRAIRQKETDLYLRDRLILFAIIEARGCERFTLLHRALPEGHELKAFYGDLAASEARHHATYLRLARLYFDKEAVDRRLEQLLDLEAEIHAALPLSPALH